MIAGEMSREINSDIVEGLPHTIENYVVSVRFF